MFFNWASSRTGFWKIPFGCCPNINLLKWRDRYLDIQTHEWQEDYFCSCLTDNVSHFSSGQSKWGDEKNGSYLLSNSCFPGCVDRIPYLIGRKSRIKGKGFLIREEHSRGRGVELPNTGILGNSAILQVTVWQFRILITQQLSSGVGGHCEEDAVPALKGFHAAGLHCDIQQVNIIPKGNTHVV